MGGQRHAPAALPPGKTRYPLYRRLGGPTGPVWTGGENLVYHRDAIPGPSSPQRGKVTGLLQREEGDRREREWARLVRSMRVSEEPAASVFRAEEVVGRGKKVLINKRWTEAGDSRKS